jgi:hypothetical protein
MARKRLESDSIRDKANSRDPQAMNECFKTTGAGLPALSVALDLSLPPVLAKERDSKLPSDEESAADAAAAVTLLVRAKKRTFMSSPKSASKTANNHTPFETTPKEARTGGTVYTETKQDDLDSAIPKKKKKNVEAAAVDLDRILVNFHSPPPTVSRSSGRKSPFRCTYRKPQGTRHRKQQTREVHHDNRDCKSGQTTAKRLDSHSVPLKRDALQTDSDDLRKRLYAAHDDDPRFSTP